MENSKIEFASKVSDRYSRTITQAGGFDKEF
jgi:hypothetical protein